MSPLAPQVSPLARLHARRAVPRATFDAAPATPTLEDLVTLAEDADRLSALSADDLAGLVRDLKALYSANRQNVDSDAGVEALTRVAQATLTATAEVDRRDGEAATRESTLSDLDSTMGITADEPETEDETDDEQTENDGAPTAETDPGTPPAADPASPSGAPTPAADPSAPTADPVPATLSSLAVTNAPTPPTPPAQIERGGFDPSRVRAAANLENIPAGQPFTSGAQFGQAMRDAIAAVQGTRERKVVGSVPVSSEFAVDQADYDGEDILDEAVRRRAQFRAGLIEGQETASGGPCLRTRPDYSLNLIGGDAFATPWPDQLPTITGPEALEYVPDVVFSLDASRDGTLGGRPAAGIGTVTSAQDLAGYGDPDAEGGSTVPVGGAAYKTPIRVDCPGKLTEPEPRATYTYVEWGNFTAVTWPEYIAFFQNVINLWHGVDREEKALTDAFADAKTLVANGPQFGASRDILDAVRRYVAYVRSVRGNPNMRFTVSMPAFGAEQLAADIALSWTAVAGDSLRVSAAAVLGMIETVEGISFATYNTSVGTTNDGSPTVLPELPNDGALPEWPTEFRLLITPDGSTFRHVWGDLRFGVRESVVKTNDQGTFAESFESIFVRTKTDIATLDVPVCVNGAYGAAVAKTCD